MIPTETLDLRDVAGNVGDADSIDVPVAPYFSFSRDNARGADVSGHTTAAVLSVETFL